MQAVQPLPRGTSSRRRVFTAVAAAACWIVLALQLYVSVHAALAGGGGTFDGVWTYFAFFTVLTNVLVAAQLTAPLVAPHSAAGKFFARGDTLAGVAVNIALICITYNLLLRDAFDPTSLERVSDELLHDFIPPLFVAHAWMKANGNPVAMAPRLRWAVWPVLYFCYVLVRGAATGSYPYPFLDVSEHGYAGVFAIGIGLLTGYAVLAAVLFQLDRLRWRPLVHGWRQCTLARCGFAARAAQKLNV